MARATARHILVSSEAKCNELKTAIEGGADFAEVAREHSSCPSGRDGGNLGSFGPSQMVREFETEKALFPESATYMDFLLNNARGGAR